MTGLMQGKRGLIMGLANDKSLAWGIAKKLHEHGAELAFSYQGEALAKARASPLAESLGSDFLIECDVSDMAALDTAFETLESALGDDRFRRPRHRLFGQEQNCAATICDTSLDNFLMTMNISAYSLVAVTKRAARNDARWRLDRDADLLWRRKGRAALQCDGRRQGRAGSHGEISRQRSGARQHPRQRASPPGRSRRWRPAASAISAIS